MTKQLMLVGVLSICSLFSLNAVNPGTLIGRFELEPQELTMPLKTFVNHSNRDLIVRWKISQKGGTRYFVQEPILRKNSSIHLDLGVLFKQFCSTCPEDTKYEFSLELFKIKNSKAGHDLQAQASKLKDGEYAVQINKSKFLKHKVITFLRNKNGLLICQLG